MSIDSNRPLDSGDRERYSGRKTLLVARYDHNREEEAADKRYVYKEGIVREQ